MENNINQNQSRQPKTIFEQLAFGLQTINDNIVDLYKMVNEIHGALYNIEIPKSEPTVSGADE